MSEWPLMPLSMLSTFIGRGIAPKYSDESSTLVINQRCIRDGQVDLTFARRHDESAKAIPETRILRNGDCLINSTGQGTLGRTAVLWLEGEKVRCTTDSHVTIVRPNENAIDSGYLGHVLRSLEPQFESLARGSGGQTELSRTSVSDFEIPLPPIDEQRRIVAKLDQVSEFTKQLEDLNQMLQQELLALSTSMVDRQIPSKVKRHR